VTQRFTDDADPGEVDTGAGADSAVEDLDDVDPEVPEADALEQHRPVSAERGDEVPHSIPADVPEADALDQSVPAPVDDDRWDA
jgi:hypothetical protein